MPTIIETTSLQQGTYGVDLKLSFVFPGWDPAVAYNAVSDTWAVAIFKPSGDQLYKTSVTFDDNTVPHIRVPLVAGDLDQAGTYYFQVTKTGASGVNVRSTVSSFVVAPSLPEGVVPSSAAFGGAGYFPIFGSAAQLVQSLLRVNAGVLEYNGVAIAGALVPEGIAVSDETTDLTTGTAKVTFRIPYAFTITGVRASVNTAPTGSTIIVDINKNGTTIMATNKLSIDASEKTSVTAATAAGVTTTSLSDDDEITIDIDQVGSTVPGKGLKVWLIGHKT